MASDDQAEIEDKVNAFMEINYPPEKLGATIDVTVVTYDDYINVSATARVDTAFMDVIGIEYMDVNSETTVQREVRGLEVVMVLDNTGSMNTNDNISALKEASESFIDILFDRTGDPDDIKIGMVPYSSSVNVGPYGLGLNESGGAYGPAFVVPPDTDVYANYNNGDTPYSGTNYAIAEEDLEYDPSAKGQWHGCVLAWDYPDDTNDHDGPWEMYRYDWNGSTNTWYDQVYDDDPFLTYGDYYNTYYGPNYHCPGSKHCPAGPVNSRFFWMR